MLEVLLQVVMKNILTIIQRNIFIFNILIDEWLYFKIHKTFIIESNNIILEALYVLVSNW